MLLADVAAQPGINPGEMWSRFIEMIYGASPPVAIFMVLVWSMQLRRADRLQIRLDETQTAHAAAITTLRDRCDQNLIAERARFDETAERTRKGLSDATEGFKEADRTLSEMAKAVSGQSEILRMIATGRSGAP